MLSPEDRRAIEGLFDRLAEVERRGPARDPEAEALIRAEIARLPGAPYHMAQTILVQEQALRAAQERIAGLEEQQQRRPDDFFGGLFGGRDSGRQPVQRRERGPWERDGRSGTGGGGFLAGAAQTALGVTGGMLLGSAIAGIFGAGGAQAAEAGQDVGNDAGDAGQDAGNDDFGGGSDDGGGFDFGGDF